MHHRHVLQSSANTGRRCRLQKGGPIDLLVPFTRQSPDHQLATVVADEHPVAILHDVRRCPARPLDGDRLCLPYPFTRGYPQAAQLSVAARAIQVVPHDDRSADDGVESIGRDLAVALPLPDHPGGRGLVVKLRQHRAGVEVGHQQLVVGKDRHRDVHRGHRLERQHPVDLPRGWVERSHAVERPDDQLPNARRRHYDRLPHARVGVRLQGAPHLFAGELVPGHYQRVRFSPDDRDQPGTVDDRCARRTGAIVSDAVVGGVVTFPPDGACCHVDALKDATGPEHVHPVSVDGRRGTRPVGPDETTVVSVPLDGPENLSGSLIERHRTFGPTMTLRTGEIGDEHAAIGHDRAAVALLHRRAPPRRQATGRKPLKNAGLVPDAAAPLAAILRPILGLQAGRGGEHGNDDEVREGSCHGSFLQHR